MTRAIDRRPSANRAVPAARHAGLAVLAAFASLLIGPLASSTRAQDLFPGRVYPLKAKCSLNVDALVSIHLDGDALPDLVASDWEGLNRLVSQGDGSFAMLPHLPVGRSEHMLVADIQGDGKDDLIVLDTTAKVVRAFFSDGLGGLSLAGISAAAGVQPGSTLGSGDVNGDGELDLVVPRELEDTVRVLFGDGAGSFGGALDLPVGNIDPDWTAQPRGAGVADLDGDGHLDIVSANFAFPSTYSLLYADGAGGFEPAVNIKMGTTSSWGGAQVQVLDVNHDEHVDLVSFFGVRLNDGAGGFPTVQMGFGVDLMVDFNEDGHVDCLSGHEWFTVRLSNGSGGPYFAYAYKAGSRAVAEAAGDFDGDGDLDAAALNQDIEAEYADVSLLINDGTHAFEPPAYETHLTNGVVSKRLALADLDDDGAMDVVALSRDPGKLSVLRGDGAGGLLPATTFGISFNEGLDHALGDVDGDGTEDAVMLLEAGVIDIAGLLLGDGAGGFLYSPAFSLGTQTDAVALGDLNEDGFADLVTVNRAPDSISVRLADGAGGFAAPITTPAVYPCCEGGGSRVQLVDLDGDKHLDALVARSGKAFAIWPGDGAGGLGPAVQHSGLGRTLVPADLDGDGDLDLVGEGVDEGVGVMLATRGGYWAPVMYPPFEGVPAVGDVDADGDPDILVADDVTSEFACLLGDGSGAFSLHGVFLAGGRPIQAVIEDLDLDGLGDLVAVCIHSEDLFDEHVTIVRNLSASPWLGLGHALGGSNGAPRLTGAGTLLPASPMTLAIEDGKPLGSAVMVIGASALNANFKGGVLVPQPLLLIFGLPLDGDGGFSATGPWSAGLPQGLSIYFQAWIADPEGPAGFSSTNGLSGTTP